MAKKEKAEDAQEKTTRREWLQLAVALGIGGAVVGGAVYSYRGRRGHVDEDPIPTPIEKPKPAKPSQEEHFSDHELETLTAAANVVLPGSEDDGFPQASDVGVTEYFEHQSTKGPRAEEMKAFLKGFCQVLDEIAETVPAPHRKSPPTFVAQKGDIQERILATMLEDETYRQHVTAFIEGCVRGYTMPTAAGGNLDGKGWAALDRKRPIPAHLKGAVTWKAGT